MASKQEIIELPVRSAVLKQDTGGLVVKSVTISEYPLFYVFAILSRPRGGRFSEGILFGWYAD